MKIRHRVLSLFLVLASASLAYAQATSAVLQGVVSDSQGGIIPGATVTVTNTETGLAREVISNESGFYRLAALPPGTYALAAQLDGFAPFARTGLVLTVGQTAAVDVRLSPAGLSEAVTVGATTPLVDTASNALGTTVTKRNSTICRSPAATSRRWRGWRRVSPASAAAESARAAS